MKSKLRATLGGLALLCLASSTLMSELFLGHESVTTVKNAVPYAMWLFIPAIAAMDVRLVGMRPGTHPRPYSAPQARTLSVGEAVARQD